MVWVGGGSLMRWSGLPMFVCVVRCTGVMCQEVLWAGVRKWSGVRRWEGVRR